MVGHLFRLARNVVCIVVRAPGLRCTIAELSLGMDGLLWNRTPLLLLHRTVLLGLHLIRLVTLSRFCALDVSPIRARLASVCTCTSLSVTVTSGLGGVMLLFVLLFASLNAFVHFRGSLSGSRSCLPSLMFTTVFPCGCPWGCSRVGWYRCVYGTLLEWLAVVENEMG